MSKTSRSSKTRAKTAAEIAAELEADPAYRQMRDEKDAAIQVALSAMHEAEAPL